jgi:hypothetical protein
LRAIVALFFTVVVVLGVVWIWPRIEGDAPVLTGPEEIRLGAQPLSIDVAWTDEGMGLESVSAVLRLPEKEEGAEPREIVLHEERFRSVSAGGPIVPHASQQRTLELDAEAMGLPEGESTLVLAARDGSWSGFGEGNSAELEIPVQVDTRPPRVTIESGLTYVRRGGSALLAYRVDEDAVRSGVRVGDAFFPGVGRDGGGHVAVFAIPVEAADSPLVEVVGIDDFGNETALPFDARIQDRKIPTVPIGLSDPFLMRVSQTFGGAEDAPSSTPLALFQWVNTELRAQNEARIAETIPEPSETQWSGGFEQMRGSKVTSEFAELREYTLRGQRVSRARHYGYDLASTSRAPITASNAGTVIHAGELGIYGNLVLIDHGLGITTLYGHLSSIEVAKGERVERGQILGRSGATGLAGGDHLHFAVIVGQTYVDPLEWWDPKWVRDHIESRLGGGEDPA